MNTQKKVDPQTKVIRLGLEEERREELEEERREELEER